MDDVEIPPGGEAAWISRVARAGPTLLVFAPPLLDSGDNFPANGSAAGNVMVGAFMSMESIQPPDEQFFRLYAENEVALHTFVRSLLPTREDAAEVMQEVMVALWKGLDAAVEFRPWAFGVARNLALMHLRKKSRDRHVFDEELVNRLADIAEREESALAAQREALDGCLQKLPASQRELVLTAYSKGVRIDQLAERRGQTPMSLYKLLHRIRQALSECVQRSLATEGPR